MAGKARRRNTRAAGGRRNAATGKGKASPPKGKAYGARKPQEPNGSCGFSYECRPGAGGG